MIKCKTSDLSFVLGTKIRPEIRSKVIECKNEKICTTVKQLYLFICKHISFQAKSYMLIVISL